MAKEKSADKDERRREKHAKKEKRSEKDGVHKKSKKDKKDMKEKPVTAGATAAADDTDVTVTLQNSVDCLAPGIVPESKENGAVPAPILDNNMDITTTLLNTLEGPAPGNVAVSKENGAAETKKTKTAPLLGALVPFAHPLADEKAQKKVLKSVRKAAKHKSLKRGVKEVVKSLRKSSSATAATAPSSTTNAPYGVVVLAADISPMDVISHIPVLCEDHGVPYIFVPSRAELGAAGSTKRPTSVVMVSAARGPQGAKKRAEAGAGAGAGAGEEGGEEEFAEVFRELVKVVGKAAREVRV